ncbi:ATP-binding protein [Marinivivus vitaminiproducens]|uniref:HAMP domain-containing sensor histidine kinase n=1 Tax=Marinivivus vitaminiproducens TaxID=3035935 RepID=UPI0027AAC0B4|nr:HAMP domain-containing sensor histidine kinase [Geminicoccaceae bacterium SCSIO 64248]
MFPARFLRTPTFRLTLVSTALFALSSLVLLAFFYATTAQFQERRIAELISADLQGLIEQYRADGWEGLRRTIESRSAARPDRASIYLLASPNGTLVAGNIDRWPEGTVNEEGWLEFGIEVDVGTNDGRKEPHRGLARGFILPDGSRLLVGRDVESIVRFRDQVLQAVLWGMGLTVLLSLAGGILVSRELASRLEAINRTTERIMNGEMSERIVRHGEKDEFDRLAGNLNAMLDRIERLLADRKQVTDDIAHDLRTPLTRMRNRIELALIGDLDQKAAQNLLDETLVEADHLITTFNALLEIAQAESGGDMAALDLSATVAEACELYRPVAEDKGLELESRLTPDLTIRGNRHRVAQAVANLLDNGIKYAKHRVTVSVTVTNEGPLLIVADDGPGIPGEAHERVLQRFVRLEQDRSLPGNGLGLSLVKAVADGHKARLQLEPGDPGLRVSVTFPQAA